MQFGLRTASEPTVTVAIPVFRASEPLLSSGELIQMLQDRR